MAHHVLGIDRGVGLGGGQRLVAEQFRDDVDRQAAGDGLGGEDPLSPKCSRSPANCPKGFSSLIVTPLLSAISLNSIPVLCTRKLVAVMPMSASWHGAPVRRVGTEQTQMGEHLRHVDGGTVAVHKDINGQPVGIGRT